MIYMRKARFFVFSALVFLFVGTGLFAQNVSLDQAVRTSADAIESGLPDGSRVAILVFTSQAQSFSDYILDELATAISANGKIQVIDRQHMDAVRRELNIQMQGDVSEGEVRRVGQQLGAQYVVTGSLVDIGTAYRFRVTAIDVESAVRGGSSSTNIYFDDPQIAFFLRDQRRELWLSPMPSIPNNAAISNVRFTGADWILLSDGERVSNTRVSPVIGHNQTTVTRVHFTTTVPNATLTIYLGVSSESYFDYAFIGLLNRAASRVEGSGASADSERDAAYSGYVSGEDVTVVTIHVPTAGNHFVEIGYTKDGSISSGSDRAWFSLMN